MKEIIQRYFDKHLSEGQFAKLKKAAERNVHNVLNRIEYSPITHYYYMDGMSYVPKYESTTVYFTEEKISDMSHCSCKAFKKLGTCEHILMLLLNAEEFKPKAGIYEDLMSYDYCIALFKSNTNMRFIPEFRELFDLAHLEKSEYTDVTNFYNLLQEVQQQKEIEKKQERLSYLLTKQSITKPVDLAAKIPARFEFIIAATCDNYYQMNTYAIKIRLYWGKNKAIIKNLAEFRTALGKQSAEFRITPKKHVDLGLLQFDAVGVELLAFFPILELVSPRLYNFQKLRATILDEETFGLLFAILSKHEQAVEFDCWGTVWKNITATAQSFELPMALKMKADGYAMVVATEKISNGALFGKYFVSNFEKKIYKVTAEQLEFMQLSQELSQFSEVEVDVLEQAIPQVLTNAKKISHKLELAPELENKYNVEPLNISVHIEKIDAVALATIIFNYGAQKFSPFTEKGDNKVIRDTLFEAEFMEKWRTLSGTLVTKKKFYWEDLYLALDFISEIMPQMLHPLVTFFIDESMRVMEKKSLSMEARVSLLPGGLLNMEFDMDQDEKEQLAAIMKAYRLKKKYIEVKPGVLLDLTKSQDTEVLSMLDAVADFETIRNGRLRLPSYEAYELMAISRGTQSVIIDKSVDKMVKAIANLESPPAKISTHFKEILRPYQLIGVYWLQQLAAHNMGGILADDMGLGKTLQLITFISALKRTKPILIVAPKTLTYNWESEFTKFAEGVKVKLIVGNQTERIKDIRAIAATDIVITSYPLLARDQKHYEEIVFALMVIDEAQHIKNPITLASKSTKLIQAEQRFALTGTPLENNVTEVWSIFDFVMPGFLGTHRNFVENVAKQLSSTEGVQIMRKFKEKISPFIMRRLKKDVLTDLPDKVQTPIFCHMDSKQEAVYRHYFAQVKEDIAKEVNEFGFNKSQIKILALLTRLRQICVDPGLFIENYEGGSTKLETLMELLDDAISGGHKVLIFSQFTSMLEIIGKKLEKAALPYCYLHGQTPGKKRLEMVETFNQDEAIPVFLLSLKAGGTGLNLTSADIVIHIDPWWNPSVENQATDRAHRFGQKNNVQVYELIAKDTIEEKILELKKKKQELFDQLFDNDQQVFTKLSEAEILGLFE
ncbi:MAG: SNF2-related protein [Culicoidibacterales bacterium]